MIDVGGNGGAGRNRSETTQDDEGLPRRASAIDLESRNVAGVVGELSGVEVIQLSIVDRADRGRHFLNIFLALARGHDNPLDRVGLAWRELVRPLGLPRSREAPLLPGSGPGSVARRPRRLARLPAHLPTAMISLVCWIILTSSQSIHSVFSFRSNLANRIDAAAGNVQKQAARHPIHIRLIVWLIPDIHSLIGKVSIPIREIFQNILPAVPLFQATGCDGEF